MLFGTAVFFFGFLPVVFVGFFSIARWSPAIAATWLFLASVFFYGYWMPAFTLLLLTSVTFNFFIGTRVSRLRDDPAPPRRAAARRWLVTGLVVNLCILAYFKYANFFLDTLNTFGIPWTIDTIVL